jgi:hypothetical protein
MTLWQKQILHLGHQLMPSPTICPHTSQSLHKLKKSKNPIETRLNVTVLTNWRGNVER